MTILIPIACAIAAYSVFLILLNVRSLWRRRPRWAAAVAAALALGAIHGSARAHFIFVVPEPGADKAKVVMSETLKPDDDVDVKLISKIELSVRGGAGDASETRILLSGDPDKNHAYNVPLPGDGTRVVHGDVSLGVEDHGPKPFLLNYHPKTVVGDPFDGNTHLGGKIAKAEIVAAGKQGALVFQVLLDGKPVAKAKTTVIMPDGKEKNVTTDADGKTEAFAQTGRFGVWARCVEPIAGEIGGKKFVETRHYPTLVVDVGSADASAAQAAASKLSGVAAVAKADAPLPGVDAKKYPKLPEATSSFGGVGLDGYLYVYGGHIAPTHHYDKLAVSGKFNRLKLDGGSAWESLEGGPALQGMNLAAHAGKVYRVGGMQPANDPGQPEDTRSVADVARFDPARGTWESLPLLPEPRSSHDVVFVGDKLYVLGGWNLKGADRGKAWPASGLVLDLSSANPTWTSLKQPFARRALIAAVHQGKIYVIGGFDENDDPSLKVSVFDPVTEVWTDGPDLPGKARNGFAPAACVLNGRLYASVMDGSLVRLDEKANRWDLVARTTPRIVHRLVPHGDEILVVGGANHGGNFDLIEAVKPAAAAAPVVESSAW